MTIEVEGEMIEAVIIDWIMRIGKIYTDLAPWEEFMILM